MPACSTTASLVGLERSAARCAEVDISLFGRTQKIFLGGVAQAFFPNREEQPLSDLQPGEQFNVEWERAVFYGETSILGGVLAAIRPTGTAPPISQSEVRSLAPPSGASGSSSGDGNSFFPAVNRNFFMFRMSIPRFGLVLDSSEPVINEATIDRIPPVGIGRCFRNVDTGLDGYAKLISINKQSNH